MDRRLFISNGAAFPSAAVPLVSTASPSKSESEIMGVWRRYKLADRPVDAAIKRIGQMLDHSGLSGAPLSELESRLLAQYADPPMEICTRCTSELTRARAVNSTELAAKVDVFVHGDFDLNREEIDSLWRDARSLLPRMDPSTSLLPT